jgi:hypothetical protein
MTAARVPSLDVLESRSCPSVTWHGGPVLPAPRVQAVFWGRAWLAPSLVDQAQRVAWATSDLAEGPYLGALAPYGVGPGSAAPPVVADLPLSGAGWLDDSLVQAGLWLHAGRDPEAAGPQAVYVVFVPPGVGVSAGRQNSQSDFAGYHSLFSDGYRLHPYAVVPCPGPVAGSPWPNLADRDRGAGGEGQLTRVACHELAEAATDPYLTGWYDPRYGQADGEVGDLANDVLIRYRGYEAQAVAGPDGRPVYPPGASLADALFALPA